MHNADAAVWMKHLKFESTKFPKDLKCKCNCKIGNIEFSKYNFWMAIDAIVVRRINATFVYKINSKAVTIICKCNLNRSEMLKMLNAMFKH